MASLKKLTVILASRAAEETMAHAIKFRCFASRYSSFGICVKIARKYKRQKIASFVTLEIQVTFFLKQAL